MRNRFQSNIGHNILNSQYQSTLTAIAQYAIKSPNKIALQGKPTETLTYAELAISIELFSYRLNKAEVKVLGLAMDNSPAWAIADLAAMELNLPVVPLPYFFSAEQTIHAINDAGINVVLSDQPILLKQIFDAHGKKILQEKQYLIEDRFITQFTLSPPKVSVISSSTAKITYTSGTTGKPKGVCLEASALNQVSLARGD
jgi:long-chain acyl-CoA synthetase